MFAYSENESEIKNVYFCCTKLFHHYVKNRLGDVESIHLGIKPCACDCAGSYDVVLALHPWCTEVCGEFNWPYSVDAVHARCLQVELLFSLLTKPLIHPETGGQVSAGTGHWALRLPLLLLVGVGVVGEVGEKEEKHVSQTAKDSC